MVTFNATINKCYIFLSDWNVRHERYIETSDVGLKHSFPILEKDGKLVFIAFNNSDELVPKSFNVREVFRSGNSVVYEGDR
jgi:hypothetical protein